MENIKELKIIPIKLNSKNRFRKTEACPKRLVSLGSRKYYRSNPRLVSLPNRDHCLNFEEIGSPID